MNLKQLVYRYKERKRRREERKRWREMDNIHREVFMFIDRFESDKVDGFFRFTVAKIGESTIHKGKTTRSQDVELRFKVNAPRMLQGIIIHPEKPVIFDIQYFDTPSTLEIGDTVYISKMVLKENIGSLCLGDLDNRCGRAISAWNQSDLIVIQKRNKDIYLVKKLYG